MLRRFFWPLTVNAEHKSVKVTQTDQLITATVGGNVTLQCFLMQPETSDPVVWYKQIVGHEPRVMATVQKFVQDPIYEEGFKNSRFTFEKGERRCHLKIANVVPSDEAVYYCGLKKVTIVFGKGTFLSVKGKNVLLFFIWNIVLASAFRQCCSSYYFYYCIKKPAKKINNPWNPFLSFFILHPQTYVCYLHFVWK